MDPKQEFEKVVRVYLALKQEHADLKTKAGMVYAKMADLNDKITTHMMENGLKGLDLEEAKVSLNTKSSWVLPKDIGLKKELFDAIALNCGEETLDELVTIHSVKFNKFMKDMLTTAHPNTCLLYTSPSPRD